MSNELISFEFESTSSSIRVVEIDGELWFVAKDVAEALEYVWNGTECVRHVPEKWRGVRSVLTPSGLQEMVVLAEQGLYFFVLRSDKPKAFPFQEWLAGDVLPALRQRGHYGLPNHSERCKKGLQSATTHRQPGQALTPSPKFIARLFGEEILAFAAQLAQRRAAKKEGGAS